MNAENVNHTPGPWTIGKVGSYCTKEGYVPINSDSYFAFAEVVWEFEDSPDSKTSRECRANARLIAAAPDLLNALKEVASVLGLNGCYEAQDRARNAIAKATGEQA